MTSIKSKTSILMGRIIRCLHVADETRYMCMVRPIKPKVGIKKNDYTNNPLYQYLDIIPD